MNGQQGDVVPAVQLVYQGGADARLVTNNGDIDMAAQQGRRRQITSTCLSEGEVADDPAERDQQVQLVAADGLLLYRYLTEDDASPGIRWNTNTGTDRLSMLFGWARGRSGRCGDSTVRT